MTRLLAAALLLGLSACASVPDQPDVKSAPASPPGTALAADAKPPARKVSPYTAAQEDPSTRGDYTAGGLYKPGIADSTPDYIPDVDLIPEPEVVAEPRSRVGNRSTYSVLGKQYHVLDDAKGYVEEGLASYYGKKFHGRRTSNLEVYDMNAFTAAHKTLPLPSFARVTNLDSGKTVVVRVNDRGPFHAGRIIDLSYAAAVKLGITQRGTGRVEVRALSPGAPVTPDYASAANNPPPVAVAEPRAPAAASSMDALVAALPVASAAALGSSPGARIATGRPDVAVVGVSNAAASAPVSSPLAGGAAAASNPASRVDLHRNGKPMSADEFDAWMHARQIRVATGQPGKPIAAVMAAAAAPAGTAASAPAEAARAGGNNVVTLQVASFSARGNAERALAMLHDAGIAAARLLDAHANGQPVWRLRVGPLDPSAAPRLADRIAGLGFGPPHQVHD